ncbi:MAG: hypothetical protein LVS60_03370 [Nodosilinea sp. LVE1205-7]
MAIASPGPRLATGSQSSRPLSVGNRRPNAPAAEPAVNLERLANATAVNIQARDITGQLVVGNKNIVVGPGGHLVVNRLAAQSRPQIKPIAAKDRLQPPPVPYLLDRTEESQTIIAALGQRQSVECFQRSRLWQNRPALRDRSSPRGHLPIFGGGALPVGPAAAPGRSLAGLV